LPLYEYRCKKCGHTFEKIQSFSAPEEKECPLCKGEVERLISAPAIQFKGAGWYVNDYAGKSSSKAAGDSKSTAEKTGSSDAAKSSSDSTSSATNSSGSSSGAGSTSAASKSD
jgi:putative FmdB family regulatory protein